MAAAEGRHRLCAALLSSRACSEARDAIGETPICLAAAKQHGEAMRVLSSAGAELPPEASKSFVAWLGSQAVVLCGLRGDASLNGTVGRVICPGTAGRFGVEVDNVGQRAIRPRNLALLDGSCLEGDFVVLREGEPARPSGRVGRIISASEEELVVSELPDLGEQTWPRSECAPLLAPPLEADP